MKKKSEKSCLQCGNCCRTTVTCLGIVGISKIDSDYVEYVEARGLKIVEQNGAIWLVLPIICPHLTEDNKCGIHDHKPKLCAAFHGQKLDGDVAYYISPGCVYGDD